MTETANEKVVLDHEFRINDTVYPAGEQIVPAEVADDLRRMNSEHNKYIAGLTKKHTYEHNSGSFAVGGGAE